MDNFIHTHGIIEPATDLLLSDGTFSSIKINYTPVGLDLDKYCFDDSTKGDFIQIASSDEKSYGWNNWKRYTITFDDLGNYSSPLLNINTNISGVPIKGIFDVRKIRTNFDYNIVSLGKLDKLDLILNNKDNIMSITRCLKIKDSVRLTLDEDEYVILLNGHIQIKDTYKHNIIEDIPLGNIKSLNEFHFVTNLKDNKSDEILVDIMKKINTTAQTITKTISIPPNVIKSLLLISPELRALDKKVYQLTKEDIMQFVELELSKRFDGCAIGTGVFEYEGTEIKLTESEIANIRQTFSQDSDFAKNIKGSKVSDLCYCTFCTEWVPNTTVHLASCGHSICKECNPPHTYRPGDLITKTRHVCYCGQVLDPDGLEELFGPGFTFKPNTVFRLCEEATCKAIVAHELTCGGTEEMCPMTCETHRPPSDIKYCPGCNAPTYHNGGCCHMTCRCDTHWCWFCGDGFTRQTIYSHMTDEHGGWYLPR
jgi:hypothetical protein